MKREKILLVEGEPTVAKDVVDLLHSFGFVTVETAATGDEALELVERLNPDLVLMDVMTIGAVDGVAAANVIGESHGVPIVFLSASSDDTALSRTKSAGLFAHVVAPFTEREFSAAVELALHKHRIDTSLRQQERWLDAILESVADGIIATDTNNRIRLMNHAAEKITGWSEEEAVTMHLADVLRDEVEQSLRFLAVLPQAENPFEESIAIENTPLRTKAGEPVQIEGTVSRIRSKSGAVEGQVLAFRDVTAVKRMTDTINYQASHDTLTGLSNRESFSKGLDDLISDSKRTKRTHALIYLDVDQFKVINDTCGHIAGDELLRHITSVMTAVVRSSDVGARLGSDEFGILLENTSRERGNYIAERLRARLNREKFIWEGKSFAVAASIGLVEITEHSKDIYGVLAAADDACYYAKEHGGNRIQVYEDKESLFLKRRGEMEWIAKIKLALDENRLQLYSQPIVPLLNPDKPMKCELLVRMLDNEGSLVMPADFLPAAERYNLMPDIDRWVITTAFEAYSAIARRGNDPREGYVYCINLSGASLIDDSLLTFIRTEIQRTRVPPGSFCFEVTETAAIGNISSAGRFINKLKAIGCTFSLDDFGSGFSSFSYLKNLPVDNLKIDGSFVSDMHRDPVNRAMVEAINTLGKLMKMETIAEFVSSPEIVDHLKAIGVDYAQGYEVGMPAPLVT